MKKLWLAAALLLAMALTACAHKPVEVPNPEPEVVAPAPTEQAPEEIPEKEPEKVEEPAPEPTPEPVELVEMNLYLPNENVDGFDETAVELPLDGEAIVDALIENGALPEGTKILSMKLDGDHMDLDMNQTYGDAVNSMGTAGELMLTGTLVNTLTKAYDVVEIYVTVEGKMMESGHVIYDFPLTFTEG